jgi:hypothetical protein
MIALFPWMQSLTKKSEKEMTMKIRTMFLAAALTISSIMTVSGLAYTLTAGAESKDNSLSAGSNMMGTRVLLQCKNYGGHQDVSKNPDIINITDKTIPKGKKLSWTASDGDKGSIVLDKPLPPNGKVGVIGTAGQSYTCKAWYIK